MNPGPVSSINSSPPISGDGSSFGLRILILVATYSIVGCVSNPATSKQPTLVSTQTRATSIQVAKNPTKQSAVVRTATLKPKLSNTAEIRSVSQCGPCGEPMYVPPQPYFMVQPETVVFGPPCCECQPFAQPCRLNFCDDLNNLPSRVADETYALFTWENALFLGAATGVTLAIRDNVDARVTHDNELHGPRWNNLSEVLSHGGDAFLVHAPLLIGMYTLSLCQQNDDLHELTLTMATSYKVTVVSALALQYITGTRDTGNSIGDIFKDSGFPSEPTAASFALAAVIDERYGWQGGLPAYLLSGLIGWSEIDQNKHTVSDVVFGAALGYMIGKSIAAFHYRPNDPFALVPFVDGASGTQGMGIQFQY